VRLLLRVHARPWCFSMCCCCHVVDPPPSQHTHTCPSMLALLRASQTSRHTAAKDDIVCGNRAGAVTVLLDSEGRYSSGERAAELAVRVRVTCVLCGLTCMAASLSGPLSMLFTAAHVRTKLTGWRCALKHQTLPVAVLCCAAVLLATCRASAGRLWWCRRWQPSTSCCSRQ
jgi:hypothetical protein